MREPYSVKRGLNAKMGKKIQTCQPQQSVLTDLGPYFPTILKMAFASAFDLTKANLLSSGSLSLGIPCRPTWVRIYQPY